jgi:hypothetical protein
VRARAPTRVLGSCVSKRLSHSTQAGPQDTNTHAARTHEGHQPVAMVGIAGGSDLDTGTREARAVHS